MSANIDNEIDNIFPKYPVTNDISVLNDENEQEKNVEENDRKMDSQANNIVEAENSNDIDFESKDDALDIESNEIDNQNNLSNDFNEDNTLFNQQQSNNMHMNGGINPMNMLRMNNPNFQQQMLMAMQIMRANMMNRFQTPNPMLMMMQQRFMGRNPCPQNIAVNNSRNTITPDLNTNSDDIEKNEHVEIKTDNSLEDNGKPQESQPSNVDADPGETMDTLDNNEVKESSENYDQDCDHSPREGDFKRPMQNQYTSRHRGPHQQRMMMFNNMVPGQHQRMLMMMNVMRMAAAVNNMTNMNNNLIGGQPFNMNPGLNNEFVGGMNNMVGNVRSGATLGNMFGAMPPFGGNSLTGINSNIMPSTPTLNNQFRPDGTPMPNINISNNMMRPQMFNNLQTSMPMNVSNDMMRPGFLQTRTSYNQQGGMIPNMNDTNASNFSLMVYISFDIFFYKYYIHSNIMGHST
ncbi:unnamed protein product [Gordionus sp. m RMFG-2023]